MIQVKILYYSNSTSYQGGAELNLLKICNHFNSRHDVNIILPDKNGIYTYYKNNGIEPILIEAHRPSLAGSKINLLKFISFLPINIYKINRYIRQNNIDIVHTNDIIDFPAMIAAKFTKAKLISHLRFIIDNETFQKKVFRFIYLFNSNEIICVSNAVRKSWFPKSKKAKIIYNGGPDLTEFTPNLKSFKETEVFNLVTVGKLVKISGHENIILALSKINKDMLKKIKLTIVGGEVEGHEGYSKMLYDLVIKHNLSESVKFVGYTKDVSKYLEEGNIFCFTPTWEHAFPTVVLEAMAMKLPVIAYKKGGIVEQVTDNKNGYLVDSIDELTEKIVHLYENENLVSEFSDNSLILLKQKFSLDKHFNELEKIYKKYEQSMNS